MSNLKRHGCFLTAFKWNRYTFIPFQEEKKLKTKLFFFFFPPSETGSISTESKFFPFKVQLS